MDNNEGQAVELYIYDLTMGMANMLSPMLLGRHIDGVWHTSIVVYGKEYFFGGDGINVISPGTSTLEIHRVDKLGVTHIPYQIFCEYIEALGNSTFAGSTYRLFDHNCNNFTDEVAQFLVGRGIPKDILDLPKNITGPLRVVLESQLNSIVPGGTGQAVLTNGVRYYRQDSPDYLTLNNQIEEARLQSQSLGEKRNALSEKLARKERKKDKKKKKLQLERERCGLPPEEDTEMAECAEVSQVNGSELAGATHLAGAAQIEDEERLQDEERKKLREPPIVYKDLDPNQVFDAFVESLESVTLSEEEQQSLDELHQYLVQGEGSWALGDNFLAFIGRILTDPNVASATRTNALRCLAACALRDDVSLILHQDRREHTLMDYAHSIDTLPKEEQLAVAVFMVNLFEGVSSSEWVLYISEWERDGRTRSNIRATTKVAVHALLADGPLKDAGTALVYNIATKEVRTVRLFKGHTLRALLPPGSKSKVFDDVSVELAMAILQHLSTAPEEEQLFRSLKALARFSQLSGQDVVQLIQMIGPSPDVYKGTSARIDEQIDIIMRKIK